MRVGFKKDTEIELTKGVKKTIKKGRIYRCTQEKAKEVTAKNPSDFICTPDDQWTEAKRKAVLKELNGEEKKKK